MRKPFDAERNYSVPGLIACLLVFIAFQQILVFPGETRLVRAFNNSLHVPFFFVITILVWKILNLLYAFGFRKAAQYSFLVSILLALSTEFIQMFTGRDASIQDIGFDLIGAISALLFVLAYEYRKSSSKKYWAALLLSILFFLNGFSEVAYFAWMNQLRQEIAPRLIDVNGPVGLLSHLLVGDWELKSSQQSGIQEWSGNVAKIYLPANMLYPGISIDEPLPDWALYDKVVLVTYLEGESPIPITIRVETSLDKGQDSKIETLIQPGYAKLEVPVRSLIRDNNGMLARVETLLIFSHQHALAREFYLTELKLE